ncbi:MAG: hypothetical protein E3J29_03325 [Dehalococcoidia bacterium]|nr:MAG: hypothetical protein E3J29_03325 [Dehalococcoidia bacterium]
MSLLVGICLLVLTLVGCEEAEEESGLAATATASPTVEATQVTTPTPPLPTEVISPTPEAPPPTEEPPPPSPEITEEPPPPTEVPPELTRIPWDEASNHTGELATVCGYVPHADYFSGSRGQPTFLYIGMSYLDPEVFTVVIWGEDRDDFPTAPEDAYLAKTVCVTGWIEPYLNAAQVTVGSPSDIVIQDTLSATPPAAESATPQAAVPSESQPIGSPAPPDFSPFAKGWGRHGFGMTVTASGEATATWRVYKWCSDDPMPPCDAMVENEIVYGGRATIVFTRVGGATAYGWVKESTDERILSGRVTLTLQPYDMALLESVGGFDVAPIVLCGPDYWQEAPESLREESPCGA